MFEKFIEELKIPNSEKVLEKILKEAGTEFADDIIETIITQFKKQEISFNDLSSENQNLIRKFVLAPVKDTNKEKILEIVQKDIIEGIECLVIDLGGENYKWIHSKLQDSIIKTNKSINEKVTIVKKKVEDLKIGDVFIFERVILKSHDLNININVLKQTTDSSIIYQYCSINKDDYKTSYIKTREIDVSKDDLVYVIS